MKKIIAQIIVWIVGAMIAMLANPLVAMCFVLFAIICIDDHDWDGAQDSTYDWLDDIDEIDTVVIDDEQTAQAKRWAALGRDW